MVHQERRRGKPRSRVLYWFRTPPGVKVGRSALDEDAIRLIEELNPDVEFDWTRILKGEGPPRSVEPQQTRHPSSRRPEPKRGAPRAAAIEAQPPAFDEPPGRREPSDAESIDQSAETATVDAAEPENDLAAPIEASASETAARARLGTEGIVRLRARYAEILTRISERIQDPVRKDELKRQADRLNPDSWVTDAEVVQGLEQYEAVFDSLRALVGQRKRRRRRRGGGGKPAGSTAVLDSAPDPGSSPDEGEDL